MRFLVFVNTSTALLLKVLSLSKGNRRLMASENLKVTKVVKFEVLYVGLDMCIRTFYALA